MFIANQRDAALRETMADSLDLIKLDLLSEYERSGRIDIAEWVKRYPVHRDELVDFWLWMKGTRSLPDELTEPETLDSSEIAVYHQALRDACLAVTFGREWLKPAVDDPEHAKLDALASELEKLRRKSRSVRDPRIAFRKAVVLTWIVDRLQRSRPRVTRLAAQKTAYLLEQAMSLGAFLEHDRKPLGPYDSKARYRDAEPIARQKGWLQVSGTTLQAGEDLSDLTRFTRAYLRSESVAASLVDFLSRFSDDELETLATVHWIARELSTARCDVSTASVLGELARTAEWKAKLSRPNFSASAIEGALRFLGDVRLIGPA